MPLSCPALITTSLDTSRFLPGRTGYNGAPAPAAIVIHELVDISMEAYRNQACSPLPKFLCNPDPISCAYPQTENPKSVHFGVTETGYVQFAELTDTTLGIDYIDGTWTGLPALLPITSVNGPFIHVAMESGCQCSASLVTLLCCVAMDLGVSLPIIAASDLQLSRQEIIISPMIQNQVDTCFASGGFVNPPNLFDLQEEIEQLQECCLTNTSDIAELKEGLQLTNNRVLILEDQVTGILSKVEYILDQIAVIPTLVEQITVLSNQVQNILQNCCSTPQQAVCFNYQLVAGQEMLVTPNQPVWLNLPTRIEDRDDPNCTTGCEGPIVRPGPLWMANLQDCTWALEASVRFRLTQWCAGKKASLYLVACGKKYLLAEETIQSTGTQAVTLTGTFLLPPGCSDVHLLVASSDDKITDAKIVEFAYFKGCCAS